MLRHFLSITFAVLAVPAVASADAWSENADLFVNRSYVCAHSPTRASQQAAACDHLERDRAALLQRYHDQPKVLAMIRHPERVRQVGYVGVDQYPAPPK
jgi:hypothetical protein